MTLLVDTSVWSLAYRRDTTGAAHEVAALRRGLTGGERVVSTGIVLLELLRGFVRPGARATILGDFAALELLDPSRDDYVAAADLSTTCRRAGVQLPAIDSMIAQLCVAHDVVLLTADADFHHAARHIPLRVWTP